jgi:hypothetical protein
MLLTVAYCSWKRREGGRGYARGDEGRFGGQQSEERWDLYICRWQQGLSKDASLAFLADAELPEGK